jgi:hypothetical protein
MPATNNIPVERGNTVGKAAPWKASNTPPPTNIPSKKESRQENSPARGIKTPPTIPLIPVMRPTNNIIKEEDKPISNPPIAPATGVKLCITDSYFVTFV